MYAIAAEADVLGPHLRTLAMVGAAAAEQTGKPLPINGAGAAGAALADLGFDPAIVRGFALLARTAGVVAHLAEEMQHPIGMPLFRELDERLSAEEPVSGRLEGKTIAITGAASGLGRAMAVRFAAEGAHVVVGDVRTDPREGGPPTVELIAERGGSAEFVPADASRWDDIDALVGRPCATRAAWT